MTVAPIEEQADPFESRRVWEKVAKGIRTGDFEMASREKSRVENEQRQRRKGEAAKGEKWQLKHFVRVESDPDCKCLFLYPSLCVLLLIHLLTFFSRVQTKSLGRCSMPYLRRMISTFSKETVLITHRQHSFPLDVELYTLPLGMAFLYWTSVILGRIHFFFSLS